MQSFFQHHRIRRQLEKQIVVKHDKPDDVWTRERRYFYHEGEIRSEQCEPDNGEPARRRREHGQRTLVSGPALHPRHTTRTHLERDGDVERADYDPEFQGDPHTINSLETLGGTVDMMLTGVERHRPGGEANGTADGATDGTTNGESIQKDRLVVVTFEGDCDPMDPHNWPFPCRLACTALLSLTAATMLWATTIDAVVFNPETRKLYGTEDFAIETVPTSKY